MSEQHVHLVGIKGTGMAALAEILVARGAVVSGSDIAERFYTDEILAALPVRVQEGFDSHNIPERASVVVHSAAYDPESHPELTAARDRQLPVLTYPEALGQLSETTTSAAIAGVHGKTTTAALCATIVQGLGLRGTVLSGSAIANLGGHATLVGGDDFFIAETCEYRRGFLSFSPRVAVVTNIEADHLDYFSDRDDVISAFVDLAHRLPQNGDFIYCADDSGAVQLSEMIAERRPDIRQTPYGESAAGEGRVSFISSPAGEIRFTVGRRPFVLSVPGRHNALNAAAAVLAVARVCGAIEIPLDPARYAAGAREALEQFRGTKRRSEIVGEARSITVIDDYGHHPTAIKRTLEGFRAFYPGRRIVLDFMSHTYSRTRSLFDEFAHALAAADVTILHEIYASAREENPGDITGQALADKLRSVSSRPETVHFVPAIADALPLAVEILKPGDLFVTMGAGNNWELGRMVLNHLLREDVAV